MRLNQAALLDPRSCRSAKNRLVPGPAEDADHPRTLPFRDKSAQPISPFRAALYYRIQAGSSGQYSVLHLLKISAAMLFLFSYQRR